MEDDRKLSYFFLGMGIGVAVGILFAPKSGEETRQLLREKAEEGKDYLRRRGEEMKDQASEFADRGRDVVSRQRDSISAALDAGRQAYRDAARTPQTEDSL